MVADVTAILINQHVNVLGWWLFAVTIVIGSIGVVAGGVVSDKFVAKMGVRSRVIILALSQIIATPFAFGSVYCEPVGAMVSLGFSYFFGRLFSIFIVKKTGNLILQLKCGLAFCSPF